MDLDDRLGSQPLVDLDSGPRQRPSPRQGFDSDPALMSLVQSLPTARGGYDAPQSDRGYTPPPLDPNELMPTSPRQPIPQARPLPPPQRQQAQPARQPQPPRRAVQRKASKRAERSAFTPWIVIGLIVVVAIVVTLIVAMSGPSLPAGK
jgi:hypothetical protein